MPARFCPSPGSYAVMRMNPVAMVEHLHDQVAHDAAASMRVKSYLAYIGPVRRLFLGYVALENHVSPPSCTSGPLAPVPRKAMVLLLHLPPSDLPPRTGRGARYHPRDVHPHRAERSPPPRPRGSADSATVPLLPLLPLALYADRRPRTAHG